MTKISVLKRKKSFINSMILCCDFETVVYDYRHYIAYYTIYLNTLNILKNLYY